MVIVNGIECILIKTETRYNKDGSINPYNTLLQAISMPTLLMWYREDQIK